MPQSQPRGLGHDLEARRAYDRSGSYLDDHDTSSQPQSRQPTRTPTPLTPEHSSSSYHSPLNGNVSTGKHYSDQNHKREEEDEVDDDLDAWDIDADDPNADGDMPSDLRPPYGKPSEGRSRSPLLMNGKRERFGSYDDSPSLRPQTIRRKSTFREHDPDADAKNETKKRYTYAAFFLVVSLISFTVQTETAVYIQHNLKWNKAYAMLYFTHGSWGMLWFLQLAILRLQKWSTPWPVFWRRHIQILHETAQMVQHQSTEAHTSSRHRNQSPWPYILKTTAFVTCALTIAGGSWYIAVDQTTASDLTAIYNCSAFFAYAFSVPLLGERLRWNKVLAVLVAVAGVLIVAYGDTTPAKHGSKSGGGTGGPDSAPDPGEEEPQNRAIGNIVIGIGSVLYGLYEVLYKKLACPPDGTSPGRGMIFANFFGSLIGCFTLFVLWIPIPILHWTGIEKFEWPRGEQAWMLAISVFCNAVFSGSFLVLISLTSPVLSSVAALLTIFLVALVDQMLPPPLNQPLSPAAILGGILIIIAFLVLSWATYREMDEERRHKAESEGFVVVDSEAGSDEEEGEVESMAERERERR